MFMKVNVYFLVPSFKMEQLVLHPSLIHHTNARREKCSCRGLLLIYSLQLVTGRPCGKDESKILENDRDLHNTGPFTK